MRKTIPNNLHANAFIMTECTHKPMSRLGIRSLNSHVYNEQNRLIGYFNPISKTFRPINGYLLTFSNSLIEKILGR